MKSPTEKTLSTLVGIALAVILFGWLCTARARGDTPPTAGQMLMVDQNGRIQPSGYVAGLSDIAKTEAQAAAATQASALYAETMNSASGVVDSVVSALTGAYGFAYVTGYTVSFAGALDVSTNAGATIVWWQPGAAGTMTTNGTSYSGHYIWHVYSEAMNSTPAIKYRSNLNATNVWQIAPYQSTAEFQNTTVNGIAYSIIYRSTVWLPGAYDSAFFMAFCEILSGGSAGSKLDVYEGFSINGKAGYSGEVVRNGYRWTYCCGALMSVTNEVAQ